MTISANSTFDLQRDQIITVAMQLAAILSTEVAPRAKDIELATTLLNMQLKALQAEGVILQTRERTTKAVPAGSAEVTLDADTLDVEITNDMAGTIYPSAGGETTITSMPASEWLAITDKTVRGRPARVYVERSATFKLVFDLVPEQAYTFRYIKVRLLRDMDTGTVTTDLPSRWLQAITYRLAHDLALAKSKPINIVAYLRKNAESEKQLAQKDETQRGDSQFVVMHSGRRW